MRMRKKSWIILLSVILIGLSAVFYFHYTGRFSFLSYQLRGIDISDHQGDIDWVGVAGQNISFAYIKASEADDFTDKRFAQNWNLARKAGIAIGAYHFYSLAYSGESQANNFISTVPQGDIMLPPVVDVEYSGNSRQRPSKQEFQKGLLVYINMVRSAYGKDPIIYTTEKFYDDYLYPELKDQHFWMRSMFSKPQNNWTFWQYSQWGNVDGISGNVDLDFFSEGPSSFKQLLSK